MSKRMSMLVVAAHPDDEIIGCGGTIARWVDEGYTAYLLVLGEGITSRDEGRDVRKRRKELAGLKRQMDKAGEIIGIGKTFLYDFPDNRFDTVAFLDIVKAIENVKRMIQPDTVYTHSGHDLNIDHRITFQAVLTATRPLPDESVAELYSFEVLSSSEWAFDGGSGGFCPNCFVDITGSLEKKLAAIGAYSSEMREFPHPRSAEAITALARLRGSQAGVHAAEGFSLVRRICR